MTITLDSRNRKNRNLEDELAKLADTSDFASVNPRASPGRRKDDGIRWLRLAVCGVIVVGSPDTVRRILTERHRQAGFEHVLIMPQFGTLPADLTEKNLRLLGAEVVPALRSLDDNNYAGFEPAVASGGLVRKTAAMGSSETPLLPWKLNLLNAGHPSIMACAPLFVILSQ